MISFHHLTEFEKNASINRNQRGSFYKSPSVGVGSEARLQKVIFKNQKIREIESEELKMIRNLNNWDFHMKNKSRKKIENTEQKVLDKRARDFLASCDSITNKKISDLNLDVVNSVLYDCSFKKAPKKEEMEEKRAKMEIVNSFQSDKAFNSNSGVIKNDNSVFLLHETVKNNILRENEKENPDCEKILDKLKVAAHKILHNFSHLKGTLSEKNLNYGLLEEQTNKIQAKKKIELRKQIERQTNGNNSVNLSSENMRLEKAQKVVSNIRKYMIENEDLMDEYKKLERKVTSLKEEHQRLDELLTEIDKRSVLLKD